MFNIIIAGLEAVKRSVCMETCTFPSFGCQSTRTHGNSYPSHWRGKITLYYTYTLHYIRTAAPTPGK